jgi:hypothetical protein
MSSRFTGFVLRCGKVRIAYKLRYTLLEAEGANPS